MIWLRFRTSTGNVRIDERLGYFDTTGRHKPAIMHTFRSGERRIFRTGVPLDQHVAVHNSFCSNIDRNPSSLKIKWSSTRIPSSSPAFNNRCVTLISSLLGMSMPLGWLCATMTAVARSLSGLLNTSLSTPMEIQ